MFTDIWKHLRLESMIVFLFSFQNGLCHFAALISELYVLVFQDAFSTPPGEQLQEERELEWEKTAQFWWRWSEKGSRESAQWHQFEGHQSQASFWCLWGVLSQNDASNILIICTKIKMIIKISGISESVISSLLSPWPFFIPSTQNPNNTVAVQMKRCGVTCVISLPKQYLVSSKWLLTHEVLGQNDVTSE